MEPEAAAALARVQDTLGLPPSDHSTPSLPERVNSNPSDTQPNNAPRPGTSYQWSLPDQGLAGAPHVDPLDVAASSSNFDIPRDPLVSVAPITRPLPSDPHDDQIDRCASRDETQDETASESEDEVIEQLSTRMGTLRLVGNGQLKYYGPTNHLNLADSSVIDHQSVTRSVRQDGQEILDQVGMGQTVENQLEGHLINHYFAWQDPSFHVVDQDVYWAARARWRNESIDTPFYSEVLTNAMCAAGAAFDVRYHPTFVTWPKPLAEFFADRAKALLEIELDSPCVATVQALVVLCEHETACKRDARGWLYSGMALRLAYDLGLHIDMQNYVANGSISPAEAEARRVTFWGTYVVDHLSGFYYGKPIRISTDDISVSRPANGPDRCKTAVWKPYGCSEVQSRIPESGLLDPIERISRQWLSLCEIISPAGEVLYGSLDVSKSELQKLCYKVTSQLFKWRDTLPLDLQVQLDNHVSPYLPHVLLMHMQHAQFTIYMHRPWVSNTSIQPKPPQGPGHLHAQTTCIESAIDTAKLLCLYEERYTFRRMNIGAVSIIFTAALILIFAANSRRTEYARADAVTRLSVCFRALESLAQGFESAVRAREFLVTLQQKWQKNNKRRTANESKRLLAASLGDGTEPLAKKPRADAHPSSVAEPPAYLQDASLEWLFNTDLQSSPESLSEFMFPAAASATSSSSGFVFYNGFG